MFIEHLQVQHLRNLKQVDLTFEAPFVIFAGVNGSGKTSLLEALYFLGYGRSFQSRLLNRIITHGETALTVFASVRTQQDSLSQHIGIAKDTHEGSHIRLNGNSIQNASALAQQFPIQLIHPETFHLLTGGSLPRRQFLDWGLFHVEPSFHELWQRSQRLLLQRNAALRAGLDDSLITPWDNEWVNIAESIDQLRNDYVKQFEAIFVDMAKQLAFELPVELHYMRGWSNERELRELLLQQLPKDRARHYTFSGPQRADIHIKLAGVPVSDALSRGQQKLLLMVLFLTQAELLQQRVQKRSCYLLDDLLAEFDAKRRQTLLQCLTRLSSQVFLTTPDITLLGDSKQLGPHQLFHVEQGQVTPACPEGFLCA